MITIDNITYVTSDVTRATKKNLIAFHKCLKMCFNAEVLSNIDLSTNLYAKFVVSPNKNRAQHYDGRLTVYFSYDKQDESWYKVCNPQFSKYNKYLSIRTSDLVFNQKYVFKGAFEYSVEYDKHNMPIINILF